MLPTQSYGMSPSFDHTHQDWTTFIKKLKQSFIASGITEETDKAGVRKRAILLSALSDGTFRLASNLVLPDELEEKEFAEIVKVLTGHFTPKRCGFAERYHFYAATQREDETHGQWAARLRGLAEHCNFKHLEDALLDKFVMGMWPGREREKLFAQDIGELTLVKAVDLAESVRCARVGAAAIPAAVATATGGGGDPVWKIGNTGKAAVSSKC